MGTSGHAGGPGGRVLPAAAPSGVRSAPQPVVRRAPTVRCPGRCPLINQSRAQKPDRSCLSPDGQPAPWRSHDFWFTNLPGQDRANRDSGLSRGNWRSRLAGKVMDDRQDSTRVAGNDCAAGSAPATPDGDLTHPVSVSEGPTSADFGSAPGGPPGAPVHPAGSDAESGVWSMSSIWRWRLLAARHVEPRISLFQAIRKGMSRSASAGAASGGLATLPGYAIELLGVIPIAVRCLTQPACPGRSSALACCGWTVTHRVVAREKPVVSRGDAWQVRPYDEKPELRGARGEVGQGW